MCNLDTEGAKYDCGHYIITRKLRKIDCESPYCYNSRRHPNPCPGCSCDRYFGPDASEKVIAVYRGYCPECAPYYAHTMSKPGRR
ncbi:uncharacterized protein BXZ73DRAFT_98934 [Epithele typhae]|uniref:uncharacterized protein n=1 Tax=Epithele typhae TaxID=378194 RepID=UPI002007E8D9|nr:uncharacterized protein BXZ73DRAFT_98934 [Epithele typhae]KAH9940507.1 hypothetical protein BXZ73DRAFT_98934 [Epithele typhae]